MYRMTLQVEGMACPMCESHINDAVRRAFAVRKVSSSRVKKCTQIVSDEKLDERAVMDAINATGYQVLSAHTEPYEKKGFSLFRR